MIYKTKKLIFLKVALPHNLKVNKSIVYLLDTRNIFLRFFTSPDLVSDDPGDYDELNDKRATPFLPGVALLLFILIDLCATLITKY